LTIYFEDLVVGDVARFGRYEVTREEVIEFASRYDPQPFHLEDEAASKSLFGRIAASGWHTAGMAMRMIVDYWKESGLSESSLGGAGMDELRWPRPVYPNDILRCEIELLEKIESRSRPAIGIIKSRWNVYNQKDELVMTTVTTGLLRRRPQGG
jgi:acyl dehydratase